MQTFLPYPSYTQSARSLDSLRLNKQRLECYQVAKALFGESRGWCNHPAVRMWEGAGISLCTYWREVCRECDARHIADNVGWGSRVLAYADLFVEEGHPSDAPSWLGSEPFHLSHKLSLVWKNPGFYLPQWPELLLPSEKPEYIWPSNNYAGIS